MLSIHLYLCNFIMFMTGIAQVVDQYYDEVGRGRGSGIYLKERKAGGIVQQKPLPDGGTSSATQSRILLVVKIRGNPATGPVMFRNDTRS